VTIRQLLDHTSGMGDYFTEEWQATPMSALREVEDYIPIWGPMALVGEPGGRERYSNYGYTVLGAIIEKVTGQRYDEHVVDTIFAPLGMDRSGFFETDAVVPDVAVGYAPDLSPKTLEEPDFLEYLLFVCSVREIPRDRLELEVTEGIEAAQGSLILDRIAALRELGFGIAIDDFGSGYSNMAYLTRLSAKTLKIDRSLVRGAEPGQRSGQLVAGVVRMAHDLGYSIVAEGIETTSEMAALSALGCDLGQGWLFGRPMSATAFIDWHRGRDGHWPPPAEADAGS